jgi:hypothetical protein
MSFTCLSTIKIPWLVPMAKENGDAAGAAVAVQNVAPGLDQLFDRTEYEC